MRSPSRSRPARSRLLALSSWCVMIAVTGCLNLGTPPNQPPPPPGFRIGESYAIKSKTIEDSKWKSKSIPFLASVRPLNPPLGTAGAWEIDVLDKGTKFFVSEVSLFEDRHVYEGHITLDKIGEATIVLTVPATGTIPATLEELKAADAQYLVPEPAIPTSRALTPG
jgi:hypothetical protein